MLRSMKYLFAVASLLLFSAGALAQKVKFEIHSPGVVAVGEAFRVEFTLNAKPDGEFVPPTFTGFDVLAGPTTSEGTQVAIVNGNVTKTVSFTYTYVLQANAEGKAGVSAASVKVDGKSYSTDPLSVEVVAGDAMPRKGNADASGGEGRPAKLGADDLMLRVTVNRNNVFKGQPVKVVFKLCARVPLSAIDGAKWPPFNGFYAQELDTQGYDWQRETIDGKVYETRVLKEVLLYPQQAGTLYIEQTDLTVIAQLVVQSSNRSQSLFDDFFGGGQSVQEVRKSLTAGPVQVTVRDFPAGAPASFNGAVGKFQLAGSVDKQTVSANASDTYVLKLSGSGNLPLIQAPKIELPSSFEQYNMKMTESLSHNSSGISGYRQFEYPFIPRAEGGYAVEPVEFSYFDPDAARYVTLSTQRFNIEVTPDSTGGAQGATGLVSGINKEELKILDRDIRFIRIGEPNLVRRGSLLFGSPVYFAAIAVILLLFVLSYLYLRKYLREMQNVTLVRNKKANKVALQRLQAARSYMSAGSEKQFYEEMLRALWGYMSDKLNIPVANLTKDNIREELSKRGVVPEQIGQFIGIISDCEYAQYSPSSSGQMGELYRSAASLLSKFESVIKK